MSGAIGLGELIGVAAVGLVAGLFFFGTLWWTVRRLETASHPHLLLFGGFLLRAGGVLAVFYWLAAEDPWAILPAAIGFLISRSLLLRWLGPSRSAARAVS